MSDWHSRTLQEIISTIESGTRPKGGVRIGENSEGVPSYGGENISMNGGMLYDSVRMVPTSFATEMRRGVLSDKDVLINKDGANTGKSAIYRKPAGEKFATINEHLFLLRCNKGIAEQEFLYHFLNSEFGKSQIAKVITGSAQPGLNSTFPEFVRIDLPPLPEQKKIAEILSGIDKSIRSLNASEKKYRELISATEESIFSVFRQDNLDMQERAVHNNKEATALGDIFEFRNGLNYSKANTGRGLRVVGVGHFKDYRTPKYELLGELSPVGLDFKSSLLEEGDFLFVRSNGNRLLIGRCLSIENIPAGTPVAHSGFTIRARPMKQHSYTRNYIKQLLQSRVFRRSVAELGGGTNISNLSQDILAGTIIALPSIQRQGKESSGLLAIQDFIDHIQRKLTKLQALKTSLQSDLLSGRKRVSI